MGTDENKDFHVKGPSWLVLYFWCTVLGSHCGMLSHAQEPWTSLTF